MTRLLVRQGLQPLARCEVRTCSLHGEDRWRTDDDGALDLALEPGIHWIKVLTPEGRWLYTVVQLDAPAQTLELNLQELRRRGHTGKVFTSHQHLRAHLLSLRERFELHQILGRGGMGIVLKARDLTLERWVALKIQHQRHHPVERVNDLMLREAKRLARLHHPNLIAIYDVLTLDEDLILITEFVDGHSLDVRLRQGGPLDERDLLRLGIQLARVISYLHSQGYAHRDIKPANLMVERDGALKLIDFGLASPIEALAASTTRVGTPGYMAPELFEGHAHSAASDLYQAGVTLYELATGQLPSAQAPPLGQLRPELSSPLIQLIERCLSTSPAERPTSARQLMITLQRLYAARGYGILEADRAPSAARVRRRATRAASLTWREAPALLAALILAFTLGVLFHRHLGDLTLRF